MQSRLRARRKDSKPLTLLSLPPDARCWWSGDHFRPHTSCLWPCSLRSALGGVLMSLCRITRSRLPDDSCSPFQARAPWTRGLTFHFQNSILLLAAQNLHFKLLARLISWLITEDVTDQHALSDPPEWSASSLLQRPRSVRSPCGFQRQRDPPN